MLEKLYNLLIVAVNSCSLIILNIWATLLTTPALTTMILTEKLQIYLLEIAAQGVAQCEVSAARVVVDAALRRIG